MTVVKAVLPAAGLGTRFLPATKALPKEMIPVIDKPSLQYVVEEAVRAGLDDILVITSRGKESIGDHFDRSLELEHHLEAAGKEEELEEIRAIARLARIHFVRQLEPLGFGHAVACARPHVGAEPFAVMVGDELVPEPLVDEEPLLERMIEAFERTGKSVVAVQEVAPADVASYGIVAPSGVVADGILEISDMVEKPAVGTAPSNLAARGRYVLSPEIFDALEKTKPGVGGEIQLTDALQALAREGKVLAFVHTGPIFDVGKKLDYLRTTVELALRRDDLGKPFKDWLVQYVSKLG